MVMLKEKLYNCKEAAEILGLTDGRIRQICRWNSIGSKIGRDWLLTEKDLEKLRDEESRKKIPA
jgi:hypothetical protein